MSQGLDLKMVREYYERQTDAELIRIATSDARGVTPEAQQIIKEEIRIRGLNKNIVKGIEAQNRLYTREEIDAYCQLIRDLNCPSCGTSSAKLNGTLTKEVVSFIFVSTHYEKLQVACPECLDKANNRALIKTALLGWWEIGRGFIKSIEAVAHNGKCKITNHQDTPNQYLRQFALSKIGQLETYKDNKKKLEEIIAD